MKYIIALLILNLSFCLQVEKSPFDLNTGGGMMFGLLFALANNSPAKNINDINGDGFADMVVAAPSYNNNNGRVYVFNGTATGISQTDAANANQTFEGNAGRKFGSSVAMIDINADGFSDLVVCEFFGGGAANSAYYFLGSSSGLGNKTLIGQATTEYCTSLVVGDFNNDGFGDVVIGDASDGSGTGFIYIYSGNATGLNTTPIVISGAAIGVTSNLGYRLAAGDINGDGWLDLVSSDTGGNSSGIITLHNSPSGFANSITSNITNISAASNIVLGDFNGDGKADLAAGESNFGGVGINQGRIHIFLSNGNTLSTTASQTIDGDNDGVADLIAGNSTEVYNSVTSGAVYFFHGCANVGLCNANGTASAKANLKITGGTVLNLGSTISMKDFNGDGLPDLLASANPIGGATPVDGAVYIFNGTTTGISATSASSGASSMITGTTGSTEMFGTSFY